MTSDRPLPTPHPHAGEGASRHAGGKNPLPLAGKGWEGENPALSRSEGGFGVYVHWPFCLAKCPYCDFNSHVRHDPPDQARFVAAFRREIAHMRALHGPAQAETVFFGGGTPSLMEPATVAAILEAIDAAWPIRGDAEITLEANPTSVEAERFRGYRTAGVNRVSLGVQALDEKDLKGLGRMHSVAEALAAVSTARATFGRVSFDLIYARPRQTPESWERELRRALEEGCDHFSLYQLTIEPGTAYERLYTAGKLIIPDDDHARALWDVTQDVMGAAGLPAYEISNHARPGEQSRHNLIYWRYGTYAGVGPGAHGRLSVGGERRATVTERQPERWLQAVEAHGHGIVGEERLDAETQADEMLLMGLRLAEGIDMTRHARLAGRPLDPARIALLEAEGLVARAGNRLRVLPPGFPVLNAVIAQLA